MIVLALESATISVGVCLHDEERVLASFFARAGRRHVETLHPAIELVTEAAGVELGKIDAVAVDVGPGLFTGLRVAIAAAKAFSFALGVPVVALTSLELLAAGGAGALDIPVVDMRRGEVAWQLPGASPAIGTPEALCEALEADPALAGARLVGDGARRYADELGARSGGYRIGGEELAAPDPTVLGRIGLERLHRGELCDAFALAPLYLRQADATVNFATRSPEHAVTETAGEGR